MFNLGYKEVVLNAVTAENVFSDAETATILGYNMFTMANVVSITRMNPEDAVAETAMWTSPTNTGDYYEVKIKVKNLVTGETSTVNFNSIGTDVQAGYEAYLELYGIDSEDAIFTIAGSGTNISAGFEQWSVSDVTVTARNSDGTCACAMAEKLKKTVTTPGTPGALYGYQLEASVRFGTFANSDPYSAQVNGNGPGSIILDGQYTAYYITYANDEVLNHEYVKHDYINAATHSTDYNFVVYVYNDEAGVNTGNFESVFPPA